MTVIVSLVITITTRVDARHAKLATKSMHYMVVRLSVAPFLTVEHVKMLQLARAVLLITFSLLISNIVIPLVLRHSVSVVATLESVKNVSMDTIL